MRTTKLGAVVASLALAAGLAATLGSTAQATTASTTTATLYAAGNASLTEVYGTNHGPLNGHVVDSSSTPVTVGTVVLQRKLPGGTWRTVAPNTAPDASAYNFGTYGNRALGNVRYRSFYEGGTDGTTTWEPSYSNVVIINTAWKIGSRGLCSTTRCKLYGTLAPRTKNMPVMIQVFHGSWKRYKVVRTNRRSHWTSTVVATFGKGTYYRAVVGGTKNEIKTAGQTWGFKKQAAARGEVSPR